MNEKLNGKPIEMPARGRPRKKETGLDYGGYGNEYEPQKPLYTRHNFSEFMGNSSEPNAIFDYIEGTAEKETNGINNMYPYKTEHRPFEMFQRPNQSSIRPESLRKTPRDNNNTNNNMSDSMLEEFNKIGETLFSNPSSLSSLEETRQVSPTEVQNSLSGNKFNSISEDKRSVDSEKTSTPKFNGLSLDRDISSLDNRPTFGNIERQSHSNYNGNLENQSSSYYEDSFGLQNRNIQESRLGPNRNIQENRLGPNRYFNKPPIYENMNQPPLYDNMRRLPIDGYGSRHHAHPYAYPPGQQWHPSFPQTRMEPNFYDNYEQPYEPQFTDGINLIGSGPWYSRKKRKTNPLLWQYSRNAHDPNQAVMHPSKYSSLDYIQGTETNTPAYLPPKRIQTEREPNNTVLPLFLSSNKELTDEFRDVVCNFKQKIREIDFTNVTVQQLKIFMREFGLNHTGKKNELIDRLKSTLHRIDNKCTGKKTTENSKKASIEKGDEYGCYFF